MDEWDSNTDYTNGGCNQAYFYKNGSMMGLTAYLCLGVEQYVAYVTGLPVNFPNGTKLSNSWFATAGNPSCIVSP